MIAPKINSSIASPVSGVVSTASELASDFVELTELQFRLVKSDGNELIRKSLPSILGLFIGAIFALTATEIIFLSLANLLAARMQLSIGVAQLIVGGLVVVFAMSLMGASFMRLRSALTNFNSSATQFAKNLDWLKNTIRGGASR